MSDVPARRLSIIEVNGQPLSNFHVPEVLAPTMIGGLHSDMSSLAIFVLIVAIIMYVHQLCVVDNLV